MNQTTPFILLTTLSAFLLFGLSGCSAPPTKTYPSKPRPPVYKETQIPSKPAKPTDLVSQIAFAEQKRYWVSYIELNKKLWERSDDRTQAQIEQRVWLRLNEQPQDVIQRLNQNANRDVQAWGALFAVFQRPSILIPQGLNEVKESYPEAMFLKHLLAKLQSQISTEPSAKKIAVFLPMESKYKHISEQIRTGLMKAFYASDQSSSLKFYDSSDLQNLGALYRQAKMEGAEFIIGPLRKPAVELMVQFNDPDMLALNSIGQAPFTQFNFLADDEVKQMVGHFNQQQFKRIGILTNDSPTDLKMAKQLQQAWLQSPEHQAELSIYSNNNPKLREAVGGVINEAPSQERHNYLRSLIGRNLTFFPRTRQDLDAIILVDNISRVAVFLPQFDFYQIKAPVYGTSQLTPNNFANGATNRDLRGIKFLTHPVVLNPEKLNTLFEAYGWDSFLIATQLNNMKQGISLSSGKTGWLSLEGKTVSQNLVWAVYNTDGTIQPLVQPVVEPNME